VHMSISKLSPVAGKEFQQRSTSAVQYGVPRNPGLRVSLTARREVQLKGAAVHACAAVAGERRGPVGGRPIAAMDTMPYARRCPGSHAKASNPVRESKLPRFFKNSHNVGVITRKP
jgi:hypothetical protein